MSVCVCVCIHSAESLAFNCMARCLAAVYILFLLLLCAFMFMPLLSCSVVLIRMTAQQINICRFKLSFGCVCSGLLPNNYNIS